MSKVYLIPIVLFVLCVSTFFGTSLATILEGHTFVPYISEGGAYLPQSCIFSQTVNISCVLLGIVLYTRFRQIKLLMRFHADLKCSTERMNNIAIWIGFGSCFGLSIVANFQVKNIPSIHYFGAILCFFLGTLYFWLQSYISYIVHPYTGSIRMTYIRFALATFSTYFSFVTIVTSCQLVEVLFTAVPKCDYLNTSVTSEWIVALIFCFYLLSFTSEFRKITLNHPKICLAGYECVILNV